MKDAITAICAILYICFLVIVALAFEFIKFTCFAFVASGFLVCIRIKEKYFELYEYPIISIPIFVLIGMVCGWAYYQIGHWIVGV